MGWEIRILGLTVLLSKEAKKLQQVLHKTEFMGKENARVTYIHATNG